jgi:hypothetical protein
MLDHPITGHCCGSSRADRRTRTRVVTSRTTRRFASQTSRGRSRRGTFHTRSSANPLRAAIGAPCSQPRPFASSALVVGRRSQSNRCYTKNQSILRPAIDLFGARNRWQRQRGAIVEKPSITRMSMPSRDVTHHRDPAITGTPSDCTLGEGRVLVVILFSLLFSSRTDICRDLLASWIYYMLLRLRTGKNDKIEFLTTIQGTFNDDFEIAGMDWSEEFINGDSTSLFRLIILLSSAV